MQVWVNRLLAAGAGFAIWALFSLPMLTGRSGIREAWDFPAYWTAGIPLLVVAVMAVGYIGDDVPWKLALWTLAGHFLGVVLVKQPTAGFGLLPLSLMFLGLPGFGAFTVAAWFGRWLRQRQAEENWP